MIKKVLIITFLLLVLYSLFLWKYPAISTSQHQNQDNLVRAQKYIYSSVDRNKNVIVGSSLSTRLVTDSLPDIYNLSFGGLSIFDGLKIIQEVPKKPKVVFIEMNVLQRNESTIFLNSLFNPVNYYSRKYLHILREDKQLISFLVDRLLNLIKLLRNSEFKKPEMNIQKPVKKTNQEIFENMLNLSIYKYSLEPDTIFLSGQLNKLSRYVNNLENQGVRIIFFEMPVNYQLENLKIPVSFRNAFYKNFSKSVYSYIDLPEMKFTTTDGMHLPKDEAIAYTQYFRNEVNSILK